MVSLEWLAWVSLIHCGIIADFIARFCWQRSAIHHHIMQPFEKNRRDSSPHLLKLRLFNPKLLCNIKLQWTVKLSAD